MRFGVDEVQVVLQCTGHFIVIIPENLAEALSHTPGKADCLHTFKAEAGLFKQRSHC